MRENGSSANTLPGRLNHRAADVYIVEDDPVSRLALLNLMSRRGYTTSAFANAEDAITAAKNSGAPRVVLVDLHLPGMNGIELIRRLERQSPTLFPVLITAAGAEALDRLRDRHPVISLQKPLDFSRLIFLLEDYHHVN